MPGPARRPRGGAGLGVASWVLLSPWIASFLVFGLYPIAASFFLSFHEYSPLRPDAARFLGLGNYAEALGDAMFWLALKNTLFFVFGTLPFTTVFALGLAVCLDRAFPGRTFFRAGFFLPTVVSIVVLSLVFRGIYAPDGPLSGALRSLGLPAPRWLLDPRTALPAIMAMDVWAASGYYMVIFLAGLKSIPADLYESAALDGAGPWQRFVGITLPLLRPTFLFVLVVNTIRSLQIFTEVFVMTRGGPLNSTLTAVYYLYDQAFYHFRLGYASAVAYLLFTVTLALSLLQFRWLRLSGTRE
jgi:multiple sugar transport system permease protein